MTRKLSEAAAEVPVQSVPEALSVLGPAMLILFLVFGAFAWQSGVRPARGYVWLLVILGVGGGVATAVAVVFGGF